MATTSPDDIWYTTDDDDYSIESITALMASSVQAAISRMRDPEIATDVLVPTPEWPVQSQEFVRIDRTVYWYALVERDGSTISVNTLGRMLPTSANIGTLRSGWVPPRQVAVSGGAGAPEGRPITGGAILPDGTVLARYVNATADIANGNILALGGVYTLV